jgi:ADP-ribose pyrophosphatase
MNYMKHAVTVADQSTDWRRGVDHIGVTVNFLIHDGKGRLLLQKRSQNTRDEQGRWDIGGGAVEFGETLEAALLRELNEEYGVVPKKYDQTWIGTALRENNGKLTHWVYINFKVLVDPDEVRIGEPDKIDEIGWFTEENLPSPLHSMFPIALEVARQHQIFG